MAILEKGCCCCALETCVKIQGYFYAILSGLATLGFIYMLINGEDPSFTHQRYNRPLTQEDMIAGLVITILAFAICVLMLIGVYKPKRNNFLLPYVVMMIVVIFYYAAVEFKNASVLRACIGSFLNAALHVYIMLHVYSLWQRRREGRPSYSPTRDGGV